MPPQPIRPDADAPVGAGDAILRLRRITAGAADEAPSVAAAPAAE